MKYYFFSLYIFFFSSCSTEKEEDNICKCEDLQLDQAYNHFFLEDRNSPFTGICEKKDVKGNLIETINYTEGKVDGKLTRYYENGNVKEEVNFHQNLQDGENLQWDENGNLLLKAIFSWGEMDTILIDHR